MAEIFISRHLDICYLRIKRAALSTYPKMPSSFSTLSEFEPHRYPLQSNLPEKFNPTNVTMDEADSISVKLTELLRHPEVAPPLSVCY